jgi:hypothetical protein
MLRQIRQIHRRISQRYLSIGIGKQEHPVKDFSSFCSFYKETTDKLAEISFSRNMTAAARIRYYNWVIFDLIKCYISIKEKRINLELRKYLMIVKS